MKMNEAEKPQLSSFEKLSRDVAESFLQTVVVVDDLAYLHEADRAHPHGGLESPGFGARQAPPPSVATSDTVGDTAHELNAKILTDAFAEKGLVCSVLRPQLNENYVEKTLKTVERADVVILDWQLQGKELATVDAADLIAKIISAEKDHDRVRLIAIYSAEKPSTIQDKLTRTLNPFGTIALEDDGYAFVQNAWRICLFAKEGTIGADSARVVNTKDLPDRLITEFTKITMGLLSNAALESLAALRSKTHRIIGRFHSGLDAPYLSHRILNDPPEEAETHIVPLMASEIESVLDDSKISESVNIKIIESWLEWHSSNKPPLYRRMHIKSKTSEADAKKILLSLLKKGIGTDNSSHPHKKWNKLVQIIKKEKDRRSPSKLTDVFTVDGKSGELWDHELALLMSTRSHYLSPPPLLTLGTIVAEEEGGSTHYYICVQPKCDCIRLPAKGREFTFLPLVPVLAASSDFTHVVRDNANIVDLQLSIKLHNVQRIKLNPSKKGYPIYASLSGTDWIFTPSVTDASPLRWIAELKSDHAQRVANDFAREISRVGLTESEWLRRSAKKG